MGGSWNTSMSFRFFLFIFGRLLIGVDFVHNILFIESDH